MSKNKTSVWSVIILVATIVSVVLLTISVVLTSLGIPAAWDLAKTEALKQSGVTEADAELVANVVVAGVIAALVFASVFDVLKIIGGFLFSLKGRWGVFCIVVSIIALVGSVWSLISGITNQVGAGSIAVSAVGLAVDVLLVIACFKHRAENRVAA